ncbi:hypothetical protein RintRC_1620 [Richelia intracellularis]|nr:hypothetical protein RintRC_1620 [Richelia intracellularis]
MGFVLFPPFFLHLNRFIWSDIPTATTFYFFQQTLINLHNREVVKSLLN